MDMISEKEKTNNFRRKKKGGQVAIMAVLFFMMISSTIIIGMSAPVYRELRNVNVFSDSRSSYYLTESLTEDFVYRLLNGRTVGVTNSINIDGNIATGTVTTISDTKEVITSGKWRQQTHRIRVLLLGSTSNISFNYGLQAGRGGIQLENTSSVNGNVYSNGPVIGSVSKNVIYGDLISAAVGGRIEDIIATSSVYANTIVDSEICGDAHYQNIDADSTDFLDNPSAAKCGTPTTPGTAYPGSSDQPEREFPISDEMINVWKSSAEMGGVISSPCPYIINANANVGPSKINCDLIIEGDPIVTLYGNVWVKGNINIKNTADIRVAPSMNGKSVVIIADDQTASTTKGRVVLENSTVFNGQGTGSYILMISQNGSAENGGPNVAINASQSVGGDLLIYAPHGEILLQNTVNLKEVTAYRTHLLNSAQVIYKTGLANLLFNSGPAGGYDIDMWREI